MGEEISVKVPDSGARPKLVSRFARFPHLSPFTFHSE